MTQEPNTIKILIINKGLSILENQDVKLTETDFESGQDSAILVRERVRGSTLECAYKKKKGSLLTQSEHTISFLPAPRKTPTILSKRDIGHSNYSLEDQPCSSKQADQRLLASQRDMHKTSKVAKSSDWSTHNDSESELQSDVEAITEATTVNEANTQFPPSQSITCNVDSIENENEKKGKEKIKPSITKLKEKIRKRQQKLKAKKKQKNGKKMETTAEIENDKEEEIQTAEKMTEKKGNRRKAKE